MKTFVVICVVMGLPGAGKTTLVKKLIDMIEQGSCRELRIIKISFDDFLSLEDQEKLVLEAKSNSDFKVFKDVRVNFVQHVLSLVSALKNGVSNETSRLYLRNDVPTPNQKYALILDDNFYYKSMRYKFYQIASNFNCGFCQVYLECCQALAEERNRNRPYCVAKEVIQTINHKIEPPCHSNFWETEFLVVQSTEADLHLQRICDLISNNFEKSLSAPEDDSPRRKEAQNINLKSLLHRADLILRALVGERMRTLKQFNACQDKTVLKNASQIINSVRQDLLMRLGNKSLLAPISVFENTEINSNELHHFLKEEFDFCCTVYNL